MDWVNKPMINSDEGIEPQACLLDCNYCLFVWSRQGGRKMEWINEVNDPNDDGGIAPMCVAALIGGIAGGIVACGTTGFLCGSFCAVFKE